MTIVVLRVTATVVHTPEEREVALKLNFGFVRQSLIDTWPLAADARVVIPRWRAESAETEKPVE